MMKKHRHKNLLRRRVLFFVISAISLLFIDLYSKHLAFLSLTTAGDTASIISGLSFLHVENQGAFLGTFSNSLLILIPFSILSAGLFVYLFFEFHRTRYESAIACGLFLGGALGNLYDRLIFQFVRDWIHIYVVWPLKTSEIIASPAFNLADGGIALAAFIMAMLFLFDRHRDTAEELTDALTKRKTGKLI